MSYNHIFDLFNSATNKKKEEGSEEIEKIKFKKELTTLNYAIEKKKQEYAERAEKSQRGQPAYLRNGVTVFKSLADINNDIDSELDTTMKKTKWSVLAKQYKDKLIMNYVLELALSTEQQRYVLDNVNYENVVYDTKLAKITSLNLTIDNISI